MQQNIHYGFVHLEFGSTYRESALELLARFRSTLAAGGNRFSMVIVDNASAPGSQPSSYGGQGFADVPVLSGDNSNREFSGWDVGIAAMLARGDEPDVWIFSNDSITARHGWSQHRSTRFAQEIAVLSPHEGPWMLGEVTHHPKPMRTPAGPQLDFVSTYCFAMNRALRQGLVTLSPPPELLRAAVHDSYEPAHQLFRAEVDPDYAASQVVWLVTDGEEDSSEKARKYHWSFAWHKAKPLNAQTFGDLRAKALCIVSEHALGARARALGADLRSPYDARTGRDRLTRTKAYFMDKLWERRYLRKMK